MIVLVDGEHYPPVIEAAADELQRSGCEIVASIFLGGTEKADRPLELPCPVLNEGDPVSLLREAIDRYGPDAVVDLSDSPVVDAAARSTLVSHTLHRGVRYEGTDFAFDPPPAVRVARRPSARVIGTRKRAGKTAVSAAFTRHLQAAGERPVVVAMGRGGPPQPEVIWPADVSLGVRSLVEMAEAGRHAASDHIEDAVTTGAVTVGTRRCGGGIAGAPGPNNFVAGVEVANEIADAEDLTFMVFEGSGAAIPPVAADTSILVATSSDSLVDLGGYLGLYRLLVSDAVLVVSAPGAGPDSGRRLAREVRDSFPEKIVVLAELLPHPIEEVEGRRVAVATTAHPSANPAIERTLTEKFDAEVVGISNHLADRGSLSEDLKSILPRAEILLTEVKAAGIDVAARRAEQAGIRVAFLDNRPVSAPGEAELGDVFDWVRSVANERFSEAAESR